MNTASGLGFFEIMVIMHSDESQAQQRLPMYRGYVTVALTACCNWHLAANNLIIN